MSSTPRWALAWVHPGQAVRETNAMLRSVGRGARLEAPGLWALETANALIVLVRRGKLTDEERLTAVGWLRELPVKLDHEATSVGS